MRQRFNWSVSLNAFKLFRIMFITQFPNLCISIKFSLFSSVDWPKQNNKIDAVNYFSDISGQGVTLIH